MQMTLTTFLAASGAVMLGSILQAATGFGAGLIIVPLLALVSLDFLPAPLIFASMSLSAIMAWQGRSHIVKQGLTALMVGLLAGIVLGTLSISAIPLSRAGVIFGVLVLVGVAVSVFATRAPRNIPVAFGAGALSGFMGTISAIGAPVLALLYQHEEGRALRATLGLLFFTSSIVMLVSLHFAGRFGAHEATLGLWLVPAYASGFLFAVPIAKVLDRGRTRIAVLAISCAAAIALIVKSGSGA
jgi:uncharacterized membrane protein YfcA